MQIRMEVEAFQTVSFEQQLTPMREPKTPPKTCAIMYRAPLFQEVCPVKHVAKVTAGLRCPPDTFAVMYTAARMTESEWALIGVCLLLLRKVFDTAC